MSTGTIFYVMNAKKARQLRQAAAKIASQTSIQNPVKKIYADLKEMHRKGDIK